jgi:hypothetical protein
MAMSRPKLFLDDLGVGVHVGPAERDDPTAPPAGQIAEADEVVQVAYCPRPCGSATAATRGLSRRHQLTPSLCGQRRRVPHGGAFSHHVQLYASMSPFVAACTCSYSLTRAFRCEATPSYCRTS